MAPERTTRNHEDRVEEAGNLHESHSGYNTTRPSPEHGLSRVLKSQFEHPLELQDDSSPSVKARSRSPRSHGDTLLRVSGLEQIMQVFMGRKDSVNKVCISRMQDTAYDRESLVCFVIRFSVCKPPQVHCSTLSKTSFRKLTFSML